jgi:hypothetical protein
MAAGDSLMAAGDRLMAEGRKLMAEGDRIMAEIAIELRGYIPDYRSMNFIAKDLPDHVYCFVLTHKEIWIYDGVDRPDRDSVEKVDWK